MSSLFQAVADCCLGPPTETGVDEFEALFVFPPEFLGFSGHFPENPVVPGIAQIMAVLHACGNKTPVTVRMIKSCKFLRPVIPGERVFVKGKRTASAQGVTISASLRAQDTLCASMTLLVAGPHTEVF